MKKQIYIETYGCTANQNNSEIMAGLLTQVGNIITNNEELADTIIINTCIVKGKTENKIKRRIQDLSRLDKQLIISGCMPETDAKQLKKLNSNLILLGTHNFKNIANLLKDKEDKLEKRQEKKILTPKIPKNKLISIHQISEGCLGQCTYCKTRLAKGKLHSYPIQEIVKSIEQDLQQGAKEIWLTSQDNGCYGLDFKEKTHLLPKLLKKILALKHRFKLRLGMTNPNHILPILEQLIEIYKNPKMFKFLHIPIQSDSDKVLKDMNRKYKIKDIEKIITSFKKEFPNIVIATDIITGYPTESIADHKKNLNFIKTHKPDVFNLSKFSQHKGTLAENLKPLPMQTIKKRTSELMKFHRETAKQNKEKYKNKILKVFIEKKLESNILEARDENYNLILLTGNKTLLGKTLNVKINQIGVHHMVGSIV